MRLLNEAKLVALYHDMEYQDGLSDVFYVVARAMRIAKAQAELTESDTLTEVGDEMMKMSTLQEFHALRVRLIQGKLEEK